MSRESRRRRNTNGLESSCSVSSARHEKEHEGAPFRMSGERTGTRTRKGQSVVRQSSGLSNSDGVKLPVERQRRPAEGKGPRQKETTH